jgi:hypothetical protein
MGVYLSNYTGAQIDAAIEHATALSPTHNDTFHAGTGNLFTVSVNADPNPGSYCTRREILHLLYGSMR